MLNSAPEMGYPDIRAVRCHNLRRLVREAGGQRALARRTGLSAAYICQMLSDKVNRNVGHQAARRLEAGMGKPYGWMDVSPGGAPDAKSARECDDPRAAYGNGRVGAARRARLHSLLAEAGGAASLAARCRVHGPYLDRLSATPSRFPADLARLLERRMGKPPGWMDRP